MVGDAHRQLAEGLLVVDGHLVAEEVLLVEVLLEAKQDLVGIDRFDEVVGDVGTNGVFHNVLLLALGNHHDRNVRMRFLDVLQGLQTAESGHILIQENDVDELFFQDFNGFAAAQGGNHVVAFGFQK